MERQRVKVLEGTMPGLLTLDGEVQGKVICEYEGDWTWIYTSGGRLNKSILASIHNHQGKGAKRRTDPDKQLWAYVIPVRLDRNNLVALLNGKATPATTRSNGATARSIEYNPFATGQVTKTESKPVAKAAPKAQAKPHNPFAEGVEVTPSMKLGDVQVAGQPEPAKVTVTESKGIDQRVTKLEDKLDKLTEMLAQLIAPKQPQQPQPKAEQPALHLEPTNPKQEVLSYVYKGKTYKVDAMGRVHTPEGPIVSKALREVIVRDGKAMYGYRPAK